MNQFVSMKRGKLVIQLVLAVTRVVHILHFALVDPSNVLSLKP